MMSASADLGAGHARPLASYLRLPADPRIGWVPYAWLLYLAALYVPVVRAPSPRLPLVAAVVATLVFLPLYFRS